jgi:hypothetical protein
MSENKLNKLLVFIILFVSIVTVTSCNKDKNTFVSYNYGVESAREYVYAQQMMTQLMATYFKSINDSVLLADKKATIDGATVYLKLDTVPNALRIEYPWWGADDGYGHWRQGVYEAYTADGYQQADATINFEFINFFWDKDLLMVDSLKILNLGKTDGKNDEYSVGANKIELIYSDTTIENPYTFVMDQSFTVLKKAGSIFTTAKDSLGVFGSLNGQTASGLEFDAQATADSTMLFSFSCDWLKQGFVSVTTVNFPYVSNIYFPEADTCANQYLIEIDSNPFPYPFDE